MWQSSFFRFLEKLLVGRRRTAVARFPATHRLAIAIVLAAFNYAADNFGISNPLQGLKKPAARPRLQSFSKEEEEDTERGRRVLGDTLRTYRRYSAQAA